MDMDRKRAETHLMRNCSQDNLPVMDRFASKFRAQPIVTSHSLDVVAVELLYRERLNFASTADMRDVDIRALESASILARECRNNVRIHCNVEISSLLDAEWQDAMAGVMCPSIVVELVERNHLLLAPHLLRKANFVVSSIRNYGGVIALDDVTGTSLEMDAIDLLRPEIIKVEDVVSIPKLRARSTAIVIVERIETPQQAAEAAALGADELQGFFCDAVVSTGVRRPRALAAERVSAWAAQ